MKEGGKKPMVVKRGVTASPTDGRKGVTGQLHRLNRFLCGLQPFTRLMSPYPSLPLHPGLPPLRLKSHNPSTTARVPLSKQSTHLRGFFGEFFKGVTDVEFMLQKLLSSLVIFLLKRSELFLFFFFFNHWTSWFLQHGG